MPSGFLRFKAGLCGHNTSIKKDKGYRSLLDFRVGAIYNENIKRGDEMKLSEIEAPAVAGVVREATEAAAKARIKRCIENGADMIDLHLSCIENADEATYARIIAASTVPVLALNYNLKRDWSDAGFDEETRTASLLAAVRAGAAGADMQGYTFDVKSKSAFCGTDEYSFTKNKPLEVVTDPEVIEKQREFIAKVHDAGGEVLLSCHPNIGMSADAVVDLAAFLELRGADIIKIVTIADDEAAAMEAVRAMTRLKTEIKTPVSYHAAGKCGGITRVINPLLGGRIAFCVDAGDEFATAGQLDIAAMRKVTDGVRSLIK